MKFFVNHDCIGCGLCAASCPEVFKMNDEDVAVADKSDIDPQLEAEALEAMDNCPVSAIEKSEGE